MLANTIDALSWITLLSYISLTSILSIIIYTLTLTIYRLTLHPLARYPGPIFAKITSLHNLYHCYTGQRHTTFLSAHAKYGPVYRYGPNQLSFNTSTALRDIYGLKANVQKSGFYKSFSPGLSSTFNAIDKGVHARKRRVISHAFSERALRDMEGDFVGNIERWLGRIRESVVGKEVMNMCDWTTYLAFDIMGSLSFGTPFNMLSGTQSSLHSLMTGPGGYTFLDGNTPPFLRPLATLLTPQMKARRQDFTQFVKSQANKRMAVSKEKEEGRRDFFHYLIEAKDPETGEGFGLPELWGESNLFAIAGSDTTATALAGLFFYLSRSPSVLDKVKKEVREMFKDEQGGVEGIKSGQKLNSCVYLKACIDEALRMSPPVPGALPREICAGGTRINGYDISAGVDVTVPVYAILHNPTYFPQPFTFKPERWIASLTGKEGVEKAHSAFCPFSVGPRACIGKNMAYMELMLSMARLLFLYDFEQAGDLGGGKGEDGTCFGRGVWQMRDIFTVNKEGPLIRFMLRED